LDFTLPQQNILYIFEQQRYPTRKGLGAQLEAIGSADAGVMMITEWCAIFLFDM
jgi:hypothetical protein